MSFSRKRLQFLLTGSLMCCPVVAHLHAAVVYVDADAGGANDGSTWLNAYTDLNVALASASAGVEIWVVEGTYTPATRQGFDLSGGIGLYGGFRGGEHSLDEADPLANATILSGDPGGMDAFHVVKLSGDSGALTIDGFFIRDGAANGASPDERTGGGMYIDVVDGLVEVSRCSLLSNLADDGGGSLTITGGGAGSVTVEDCSFSPEAGSSAVSLSDVGVPVFMADVVINTIDASLLDVTGGAAAVEVGGVSGNLLLLDGGVIEAFSVRGRVYSAPITLGNPSVDGGAPAPVSTLNVTPLLGEIDAGVTFLAAYAVTAEPFILANWDVSGTDAAVRVSGGSVPEFRIESSTFHGFADSPDGEGMNAIEWADVLAGRLILTDVSIDGAQANGIFVSASSSALDFSGLTVANSSANGIRVNVDNDLFSSGTYSWDRLNISTNTGAGIVLGRYAQVPLDVTLDAVRLSANRNGGLSVSGAAPAVSDAITLLDSDLEDDAESIVINNSGAGLDLHDITGTLMLADTSVIGQLGAGVVLYRFSGVMETSGDTTISQNFNANTLAQSGGIRLDAAGDVTFEFGPETTLQNNRAEQGGAIFVESASGSVTLLGGQFINNEATVGGGALAAADPATTLDISGAVFRDNRARETEPPALFSGGSLPTFAVAPRAIADRAVTMIADVVHDPSGGIEYFFDASGAGGDSGWQRSPVYTDFNAQPARDIVYRVKARDGPGNETPFSAAAAGTVQTPAADAAHLIPSDSPDIVYSGDWTLADGLAESSGIAGESAEFTFTGSYVAVYGNRLPGGGKARVIINGVPEEELLLVDGAEAEALLLDFGVVGSTVVEDVLIRGIRIAPPNHAGADPRAHTLRIETDGDGPVALGRFEVFDIEPAPASPEPLYWESAPFFSDTTSVTLSVNPHLSFNPPVEYQFTETTSGRTTGWIAEPFHTDTVPDALGTYSYKAVARDAQGNLTQETTVIAVTGGFLQSSGRGGAVFAQVGALSLGDALFVTNEAAFGGALCVDTSSSAGSPASQLVDHSVFVGNTAHRTQGVANGQGGAVYVTGVHPLSANHLGVFNNTANRAGGALFSTGTDMELSFSTLRENFASDSEAGNFSEGGGIVLENGAALTGSANIIWNSRHLSFDPDTGAEVTGLSQIVLRDAATSTLRDCIIEDDGETAPASFGANIITDNPEFSFGFLSVAGVQDEALSPQDLLPPFRLRTVSPATDAASEADATALDPAITDLAGAPLISPHHGAPDIGAIQARTVYELLAAAYFTDEQMQAGSTGDPLGDANHDGLANIFEVFFTRDPRAPHSTPPMALDYNETTNDLEAVFSFSALVTDAEFQVQSRQALADENDLWSDGPVVYEVLDRTPATTRVRARVNLTEEDREAFLRVTADLEAIGITVEAQ